MHLIDYLLGLEVPAGLSLSPDGKSVVYYTRLKLNHRTGEFIDSTLWVADTTTEKSARKLIAGDTFNDRVPQWSPDGSFIAFLSDRGKRGKSCAICLTRVGEDGSISNDPPEFLTSIANERIISKFAVSPNGKQIAFISPPEKTAEQKAREEAKDDSNVWGQDWGFANLRLVDTETGTVRVLFEEKVDVRDLAWNDEGDQIVFATCRTPHVESTFLHGTTFHILNVSTGQTRPVSHIPRDLITGFVWKGSQINYLTWNIPEESTSGLAVYSIDVSNDNETLKKTGYGVDNCPQGLTKAGDEVIVYVQNGMEDQLRTLDGKVIFSQKRRINKFDAVVCEGKTTIVLATGDINNPTEVFARTEAGTLIQLSGHDRSLGERTFGKVSFLECQTLDGKETLQSLYITPRRHADDTGKPSTPLPTVVFIHGGPYYGMTDSFDSFQAEHSWFPLLLTGEGFGILIPNYRGSSGRGERFASYARGGMGVYDEPDIVAAVQHAIEQGYADPHRLVAEGWSQGGFLSYLSAVRNGAHGLGWKFKAVIAGAGVTDWDTMALTSDIGYVQAETAGGAPWELHKGEVKTRTGSALWEFQDAVRDHRIPPILILHGERDMRVPVTQAWGFRRAMDQAGLPFEMVTYPREGHFFSEREHIKDLIYRMQDFVEKHIGSEEDDF